MDSRKRAIAVAQATNAERTARAGVGRNPDLVDVPPQLTWAAVKEEMADAVRIVGYDRLHRSVFHARYQKQGEKFSDYAFDLLRIAKKGYPKMNNEDQEALVFERLVEGALPQFRQYLVTSDITTLKAAITKCQLLESVNSGKKEANVLVSQSPDSSSSSNLSLLLSKVSAQLEGIQRQLDAQARGREGGGSRGNRDYGEVMEMEDE